MKIQFSPCVKLPPTTYPGKMIEIAILSAILASALFVFISVIMAFWIMGPIMGLSLWLVMGFLLWAGLMAVRDPS